MDISFFGDFLFHRGLIDTEQLNNAVDHQLKQNKSIGQIALEEKLLTEDQILKIKQIQKLEDKKFGEIAVENKILFPEQLDVILEKQKKINIFFGDALSRLGYMDAQKIDELAREFEELQKNKKSHIYTELAFCDREHILDDSVETFKNMFYRGFQEYIKFKKIDLDYKKDEDSVYLSQKLIGDMDIEYLLVFDEELENLSKLSKKSKEERTELFCELMQDLIKRVAINLTHRGIIVKNSDCEMLSCDRLDLSEFDQLKFISTAGEIKLYIKI